MRAFLQTAHVSFSLSSCIPIGGPKCGILVKFKENFVKIGISSLIVYANKQT